MKKQVYLLALVLFLSFQFVEAQVAINTDGSAAAAGAVLHVKGTAGNHFYISDANGYVGIGTLSPTELLHVAGAVRIGAYVLPAVDGSSGQVLTTDGSGAVAWATVSGGGSGDGDAWGVTGEDQTSAIGRTGDVGIGTNTPGALLDVAGHIWISNTGQGIFIGENAGENDNLNDLGNVYLGYHAGMDNVLGNGNIGIGYNALQANTAEENTAVGTAALAANVSGHDNCAFGNNALLLNSDASFNTAIGSYAMSVCFGIVDNTAVGFNALRGNLNILDPASGNRHTAIGYESLVTISDAMRCTGVGYKSLTEVKDGNYNTGVGYNALKNVVDGDENTSLGYDAYPLGDYNNTTSIGANAHPTTSNQIMLGDVNVTQVKTAGGITVGNTTVTEAGTIRFDGTNFWGYNGSSWVQLDN